MMAAIAFYENNPTDTKTLLGYTTGTVASILNDLVDEHVAIAGCQSCIPNDNVACFDSGAKLHARISQPYWSLD
jgi:hypothetical protein